MLNNLERLEDNVHLLLAAKVEQTQAEGEEAGPLICELALALLIQQRHDNGLAGLGV